MIWLDRFRRPPPADRREDADAPQIDPGTGEVLAVRRTTEPKPDASRATTGDTTIQGERTIPSVNRERSIQSRISGALALAAIILLGTGFLFWYYNTQYARTREAEEAARKAAAARAGGEMKVPPLGRINPPTGSSAPTSISDNPPPPGPANTANAGPQQKTPEQIALERQLGAPVLRRAQSSQAASVTTPYAFADPATLPGGVPGMAQLIGALQAPNTGSATLSGSSGGLAAGLRPTPTPEVAAQVLPTRRMLLPKGAFIDCTLETAIDSTYGGMVTCIGASDVYGADGKVVLLERGTKYVGEQRGTPRQGQGRVFVVWNEARTPTGVVALLASPGTDELGRSGLPGFVNTHFWDRFGTAILISVIDGTMQAIAAHQQSGTSVGGGGGVVLAPQGSRDVIAEVLRSTVSIPPTVVKNQGERIQILVARDVDFRSVYALRSGTVNP
ncbi:type IV secretion system protein VirB10 [Variovorax sp. YR266]|uniref:type IV secretion system protein VirB10 n=1 Tax=Variovorax sp. YR266 TaxID=1884386 RepID=UPI00089CC9FF|nr:type IV secretion system protein VirB10 [Variovorax sp. YR266]SDZ70569.1 type IV secretion system protein VirB10 [Variovorax sp. YR266]